MLFNMIYMLFLIKKNNINNKICKFSIGGPIILKMKPKFHGF